MLLLAFLTHKGGGGRKGEVQKGGAQKGKSETPAALRKLCYYWKKPAEKSWGVCYAGITSHMTEIIMGRCIIQE